MVSLTYVFLCCFLASVLADDKYTDKYDNLNAMEIMSNDKLRKSYLKCLLDEGKCTPDASELKSHISDALQNRCEKCTEIQKNKTVEVIDIMVKKYPEDWKTLTAKYDPDGVWTKTYEDEARAKGIDLPKP